MKKRTKEENAAYSRMLREKKRSTGVAPTSSTHRVTVAPVKKVAPCEKCNTLELEVKKLLARIALLELQVRKGIKSEAIPSGDDADSLRKRVLAVKFSRFQSIGLNAHGG
jgi:hypothetical protein